MAYANIRSGNADNSNLQSAERLLFDRYIEITDYTTRILKVRQWIQTRCHEKQPMSLFSCNCFPDFFKRL